MSSLVYASLEGEFQEGGYEIEMGDGTPLHAIITFTEKYFENSYAHFRK